MPSIAAKQVSPHIIRHSTAMHLLRAGVDINTIRGWLGHVSLSTTNIYAEIDRQIEEETLAREIASEEAPLHESEGAAIFGLTQQSGATQLAFEFA